MVNKNKSIWSIFQDEEKYLKIGKNLPDTPLVEEEDKMKIKNQRSIDLPNKMERNHSNPKQHQNYNKRHSYQNVSHHSDTKLQEIKRIPTVQPFNYSNMPSFYGQNIYPVPQNMSNMGISNLNVLPQQPILQYPSFGVGFPYPPSNGIYPNQFQQRFSLRQIK